VTAELSIIEQHLRALEEGVIRLDARLARLDAQAPLDSASTPAALAAEERLETGEVVIEHHARRVYVGTVEVPLSPAEYRCLYELVRNAGRVILHRDLLRRITGDGTGGSTHLKVYIARLRAKLRTADAPDGLVESVRGVGYRLATSHPSAAPSQDEADGGRPRSGTAESGGASPAAGRPGVAA